MNTTRILSSDTLPSDLKLPTYLLVHNTPGKCLDEFLNELVGHFVAVSDTTDELSHMVPEPRYPADPVLQGRVRELMGWDEEGVASPTLDPGMPIPKAYFDTNPNRLHWLEDESKQMLEVDIFGESYTILWVCGPDLRQAVGCLMAVAEKLVSRRNRAAGGESPRLDSVDLRRLWQDYLEVMFFVDLSGGEVKDIALRFSLVQELEQALALVPWGPKAIDWARLDEDLSK